MLDEIGGRGRPGVTKLRAALERRPAGGPANGYLEVLAAQLDVASDCGLVRQFLVPRFDGEAFALDWAFPDVKLNIEWDGDEFHTGLGPSAEDMRRDRALRRLGWTVRRFPYSDVQYRPAWVTSEILAMLQLLRAGKPVPSSTLARNH